MLLVEDDPAVAESVARGLNAEGFVTEVASDGATGLWMAQENEFDLGHPRHHAARTERL